MKRTILLSILLLLSITGFSQNQATVKYEPSYEDFINPERGFIRMLEDDSGPITSEVLAESKKMRQSMVWRQYNIRRFKDKALSKEQLDIISKELGIFRENGMKCILRFAYNTRIGEQDAPLEVVLFHLDQLAPILKENSDVIALMHCGFIGAWGEMHSSENSLTEPENMRKIVFKILEVLPMTRSIQVRTPQHKQNIFNRTVPITYEEAFSGKPVSRVGHHNDCLLASPDDVGTYQDIEKEKEYLSIECLYTPMGGETCTPRDGIPAECSKAISELERMRWSYLNSLYSRKVLDAWASNGCLDEISRRLGYRFEMLEGNYDKKGNPGSCINVHLSLRNVGFASPFNSRMVELILKEKGGDAKYKVKLPQDPRFWFPKDTVSFSYCIGLPEDMKAGEYELFLNLPDPEPKIYQNPAYSIRVANKDSEFTKEGYNSLNHTVTIDSKVKETYKTFLKFESFK